MSKNNKNSKSKSAKKNAQKNAAQKKKRNNTILIIIVFAVLVVVIACVAVLSGNSETESETTAETTTESTAASETISSGESLVINCSDITESASFYPINVDGTEMEVIAIRDDDGDIRTAFNTCEVCYSSGKGYYVEEGDYLVCQNCGNKFTAEDIGTEAYGCTPWPILDDEKTVTDSTIEISYDFLVESKNIFASWKA